MNVTPEFSSVITVEPIDRYGGDWLVCDAARVSRKGKPGAGPRELTKADKRLIEELVGLRHGAPFQHGGLTFFVEAPIFVFREWRTHRVYMHQSTDDSSYSEMSARYRGGNPKFWVPAPTRDILTAENFKAMRPEFLATDAETYTIFLRKAKRLCSDAWVFYEDAIANGIAQEVASRYLPVSMFSAMYVSTNPRSLSHFLSLRTHDPEALFVSHPQAEIEEAARQAEELFKAGWPATYEAWNRHGRHSL